MSTAQALISGMSSPPPSQARASEGRRADGDGSAFRDTLDSASRSEDPGPQEQESKVSRKSSSSDNRSLRSNGDTSVEADGTDVEESADDAGARRADEAASAWSLILAILNDAASGDGNAIDFAAALERARPSGLTGSAFGALGSGAAGTADEAGAAMQGLGESGEFADINALLDLLKSKMGASGDEAALASAAASLEGVTVEEIKATVLGQEKHLALDPAAADVLAQLARAGVAEGEADGGEAVPTDSAAANAEATATLVADDALDAPERQPAAPPQESRAQGSNAQGRGWQDGAGTEAVARTDSMQQGGSGQQSQANSGQGNGQGGSAVFASLVNGGPRAVAGAADAGDDFASYASLGDQIAAGVRAEAAADGLGGGSSDGVVKVLQIELKPANLGSVTVRIALKDNAITLHLETQRRETLAAIERDRDQLMGALSSAGYTVDGITAAPQSEGARSSTAFSAQGVGADAGAAAGQQGAGQSQSNASSGERNSGQSGSQGSDFRSPSSGKDDAANGARRAQDGLYV